VSAPDLKSWIRPGDHIVWSQAAGEPLTLIEALLAQRAELGPLSAFMGASFADTVQPEHADHIRFSSFGAIGQLKRLTRAGVLDVIPCHASRVGPYIMGGEIGCDVAMVQVSPVGPNGLHSYGVTNDYMPAAVARARVVIAEVNAQVPFTYGDGYLAPGQIHLRVDSDRPVVQAPSAPIGETDIAMAQAAAAFIGDGATLQMGVGATPDALLRQVADRRDLGVHSGIIGDAVVELIEKGAVTNARKPFDQGITVTGALIGTDRLYRFADRNPALEVRASAYVQDTARLAALPNLITVNTAIEVDLTGQVNAEQVAGDYLGGTGGHADFTRAGQRSAGGFAIVALPATAKGGAQSRIVLRLSSGVTTARTDVDVVVTEFGSAELRAQPFRERARRLIAIAHPDFREGLERDAHELMRRGF
jgi:acyl-CoA hydrolase